MASNYQDVLQQLESAGLLIDQLQIGPTSRGNPRRVKVDGEHGKPGWYVLHELTLDSGDTVLVGSYGVYRGNDAGAQKIKLQRVEMTAEQKAAYRARMQEDRKRAAQLRGAEVKQAAAKADEKWRACLPTGEHDYLTRKGIGAHGVRFAPEGMFLEYDGKGDKPYAVPVDGALVVPLQDLVGRTFGLQFILSRARHADRIKRLERDKEYWPPGFDKIGHLHLIGAPSWIILVAEGYATGATLHEATGHPVAIAFDAGNLQPVAQALHKRYPKARILICADDDAYGKCRECKASVKKADGPTCPACGQPHGADNAGVSAAQAAALAVGGAYIAPAFADDARWAKFQAQGHKITDFNDLHAAEGLAVVRAQVEDKLHALGWEAPTTAARVVPNTGGGGQDNALRPIETQEELLERYALVYGQKGTVFDHQEHCLVALSDMRDACIRRELHRRWCEHPLRKIVRVMEVGFDPAGEDPNITCNLWDKWPTTPKAGRCERLLELLRYMCMGDANAEHLFQWVLRWIAFPIQHPGAKMKTTLVIHGPQGTGKNLFFECVMAIYGRYGRVIDQSAIEDKFNDWASRKLFLIADEVVARLLVPLPGPGEFLRAYKISKRYDDDISAVCLAVRLQLHGGVVQSARIGAGGEACRGGGKYRAEPGNQQHQTEGYHQHGGGTGDGIVADAKRGAEGCDAQTQDHETGAHPQRQQQGGAAILAQARGQHDGQDGQDAGIDQCQQPREIGEDQDHAARRFQWPSKPSSESAPPPVTARTASSKTQSRRWSAIRPYGSPSKIAPMVAVSIPWL